jgi:hypothetical protein
MPVTADKIDFLTRHWDLLPLPKQAVARWLCESWAQSGERMPRQLYARVWLLFPFDLKAPSAPEKLIRELTLELLSSNRNLIARRERLGASRKILLGPRRPHES